MKKALLTLFVLATLLACKDQKTGIPEIDPAFSSYVSAFTSGVVSATSNVVISLASDLPEAIREQALEQDLLEIKPAVKGNYTWVSSRRLEFVPEEALQSGTLYECKFQLGKLMEVPAGLEVLEFQFQTIQQSLFVEFMGLSSLDEEKLQWQQLRGILRTADYADVELVEQALEGAQDGKALRISWNHNSEENTHEFTVDSISRTEEKGQVLVKWDGRGIHSEDSGEELVQIPPLGDFKLMNIHVQQQPEQYVSLYFSDPISRSQDLRGLIYLESGEEVRLERQGSLVKVYPAMRLQGNRVLRVNEAVRNSQDYPLAESYSRDVLFASINPDVALVGDGVILPGTDGLIFPFKAVNLRAVNVRIIKIFEDNIGQFFQENQLGGNTELKRVGRIVLNKEVPLKADKAVDFGAWNLFSLDLAQLIQTEPGAIYNVSITFDRSQSLLPCAEGEEESDQKPFKRNREVERFNDPPTGNYYWDYYYEDYNWNEREDPCTDSYYIFRKNRNEASRNVFASDLGIIAKGGSGSELLVAVTSLKTTEPLAGVDLEIYNYQNRLVEKKQSGSDGMASISLEQKPYLLVARQGNQQGYLRLDDGSSLSTSMFDVSGSKNIQGLKGFLYGERGVWRPGDSIYLTFVLEDKLEVLPGNHPVRFELFTPENQLYGNRTLHSGLNGVYDFRTATEGDAPTGNWLAKISVGGTEFTKTLKIETVKPNRLKIELDFGSELLKRGSGSASLNARWLHGAIARNLKADIELDLSATSTSFREYPDYVFDDPAKRFEADEEIIFEGRLNEQGSAVFRPGITVGKEAPGMLQAFFKTRVFENSGDFSVDRFPVLYSPYEHYVGLKIPEGPGWNGALYSDESNVIPIVTVDESGQPVDIEDLAIEIYDVRWRWWWDRDEYDDLASYVGSSSRNLIRKDKISTVNGKAMYELNFGEKLWGRKLIRITDTKGGHSTGQAFYLDYRGYWETSTQEGPGGAEMLSFTTDRKDYQVGEEITLNLPEIEEGRALVSIENGSRILRTFWVEAPLNDPLVLEATPDMAPNAYVHISLIQPHRTTANDRPIRMYGIQSVNVVDPQTMLHPVLDMPDVLEPEQEVSLEVWEQDGRSMTYTVAVVDEGLLDLTRFRTPDPWNLFYAREALGIRTWDLYKYVLGALKGEMAGLLSIGGDEFIEQDDNKNENRFKPVVQFLGPFELQAGRKNKHSFTMPNYVGSVRTMVVASEHGAYGKTDKATPVKKPLMVLATLPRVASPSETVSLPVTVFAMDPSVKNVTVEVQVNEMFQVEGPASRKISFEQEGDQLVEFTLKVARGIGAGQVEVVARSGNQRASDLIDLQVRMPNPRISRTINEAVEPGRSWQSDYEAVGLAGTNHGVLEVSVLPPMNLEKRLNYLMTYPHGCVEQTISAVFPQLYLHRFLELDARQRSEIQENITAGINRIRSFQVSGGGLTYWPGSYGRESEWGTSYAGHFMLEAQSLGYKLPVGFINNWIKYQNRKANSWDRQGDYFGSRRSDEINQAYRLYTLALAKKPALGAMNRMREMPDLTATARWTLAGAYLLAGKQEVARQLVAGLDARVSFYRELSHTYGSSLRDQAMILEVMTLMDEQVQAKKVVDEIAAKMASGDWYSTQTTAWVLLAIARFVGETDASDAMEFEYTLNGKREQLSVNAPMERLELPYEGEKGGTIAVKSTGERTLFLSMQLEGIPLENPVADEASDLGMDVRYFTMEGEPLDPAHLEQGTDFMAEVTLKHPGVRAAYEELALTQMFPSGWEIRNLRLDDMESSHMKSQPEYQDIRDDRVYSYFGLGKGESKTFVIMLNAAYLGEFFLPAVYCEAMYDNEIHATRSGKWVRVSRQGE